MPDDRCELVCLDLPKADAIRHAKPSPDLLDLGAQRARGLADPTRLMLATALMEGGELCVCDLAWIAERAQNLVSHHLRALRTAGLVASRRDGKMVMYSLTGSGRALVSSVVAATEDVIG